MTKRVSAENIADLLEKEGLTKTAHWILVAKKTGQPELAGNIFENLEREIAHFRNEQVTNRTFKVACFDTVYHNYLYAMDCSSEFNTISNQLSLIVEQAIDSDRVLKEISLVTKELSLKPRYFMCCFYYLILWEGVFKNVMKNLLALNMVANRKKVIVNQNLELSFERKERKVMKDIFPLFFKTGGHDNLRNAIAHAHFRFIEQEHKMEFWDIDQKTLEYSLKPLRVCYEDFYDKLVEVNVFCEIFRIVTLAFVAIDDIKLSPKNKSS